MAIIKGTQLPSLEEVAEELDFTIPPLLARLFGKSDLDPKLYDWLDTLLLAPVCTGLSGGWLGSDPCLLGLITNGLGDVVSFYYYPPTHEPGAPLPIVEWYHEDNSAHWIGQNFDDFLASQLQQALDAGEGEFVGKVLEKLELPETFPKAHKRPPAPEWFIAAHGRDPCEAPTGELAKVQKMPPLKAERALVRYLTSYNGKTDPKAHAFAQRLYAELGWDWHCRNIEWVSGE